MFQRLILVLFFISALADAEETRKSTNTDGKELTFGIAKLHPDGQLGLDQDSSSKQPKEQTEILVPENAVFDTLCFGDDRKTVTTKLQTSKIVKSNISGEFFGRTGLNGVFETREKVANLKCSLYFGWDADGKLIEITLRSDSKTDTDYDTILKPCWLEFVNITTRLHGQPQMGMEIPKHNELTNREITVTHIWKMAQGGDILLGTSRMGDTYQVNLRFTKEEVE